MIGLAIDRRFVELQVEPGIKIGRRNLRIDCQVRLPTLVALSLSAENSPKVRR